VPSRRALATFDDLVRVREDVRVIDDRLVHSLPLDAIQPNPRNPRQRVDSVAELADGLHAHGLLQPIVVRRRGAGYQLIAGHRRNEAARQLGWPEIAAVVRDETDDQAYILMLVENLQRDDLTPKEEAAALEVLVRERRWTTRQVGEAIKRSLMYVSRRLRVFDDPVLASLLLHDGLAVSTAEELLRAPTNDVRQRLAAAAAADKWTPAVARREVAAAGCNESLQVLRPRLASRIRALTRELAALEYGSLSPRARCELTRLIDVAQQLHTSHRSN
jgi:ParB/RepB/Spo0J family partition protein